MQDQRRKGLQGELSGEGVKKTQQERLWLCGCCVGLLRLTNVTCIDTRMGAIECGFWDRLWS
jgi:hypothetical protein